MTVSSKWRHSSKVLQNVLNCTHFQSASSKPVAFIRPYSPSGQGPCVRAPESLTLGIRISAAENRCYMASQLLFCQQFVKKTKQNTKSRVSSRTVTLTMHRSRARPCLKSWVRTPITRPQPHHTDCISSSLWADY